MTDERGTLGNVATLLVEGRKTTSLSQADLAERAGVSRSAIVAAEARSSLPTMDVCIKVARALSLPLEVMVRAHAQDAVGLADPGALAEIEGRLGNRRTHWEEIAEHHGLVINHGTVRGTVDQHGDLRLNRSYKGCSATRPRQKLVFRDRIIGEKAPLFAIKGTPKSLDYSVHVSIEGEWAQHRVEFRRPWSASDGSFDFEFETTLPRAYVLELDELNQRRRSEGLPTTLDGKGEFCGFVAYSFEQLELAVTFPRGYHPQWSGALAIWGTSPVDDADFDELHQRTCRRSRFDAKRNEARLTLERPAPGYLFGIRWRPGEWEPNGRTGGAK